MAWRPGRYARVARRLPSCGQGLRPHTRARSFIAVTRPDEDLHRIRLTLHYDGSGFNGWQAQAPGIRTVQGELEAAISRLTDRPTRVTAAGRTDSGVHATGQVASAQVPPRWTPDRLATALNAILPFDMWIADARVVPADFHARFGAIARGYVYRIGTADVAGSPFVRRGCWPLRLPLSLDKLNAAARQLAGTHSFLAFAKAGQEHRGDQCTVHRSVWREWGRYGVEYHVVANRFLHHMVRYLVGTMTDVARDRRPLTDVTDMLRGTSTLITSPPAPSEGLFLSRVFYTTDELNEESLDETVPG
jgi:tRNA pseudouridine38-40 synthase